MRIRYIIPFFLLACNEPGSNEYIADETDSSQTSEIVIDEERVTAVEFNNELTYMQEGMLDQIDILFGSDSANVDLNLENAIFEAESSLQKLETMDKFENSEAFVTSMTELFTFYKEELNNGFPPIAEILKKSELSKSDDATLEAYDLNFSQNEADAFEKVFAAQDNFAKENNIRLTDQ